MCLFSVFSPHAGFLLFFLLCILTRPAAQTGALRGSGELALVPELSSPRLVRCELRASFPMPAGLRRRYHCRSGWVEYSYSPSHHHHALWRVIISAVFAPYFLFSCARPFFGSLLGVCVRPTALLVSGAIGYHIRWYAEWSSPRFVCVCRSNDEVLALLLRRGSTRLSPRCASTPCAPRGYASPTATRVAFPAWQFDQSLWLYTTLGDVYVRVFVRVSFVCLPFRSGSPVSASTLATPPLRATHATRSVIAVVNVSTPASC